METFSKIGKNLIAKKFHETIQIEPWGTNSFRIRSTMGAKIRDDLPGALLPPENKKDAVVKIDNVKGEASIINGLIEAKLSIKPGFGNPGDIQLKFVNSSTGEEITMEDARTVGLDPPREFKSISSNAYKLTMRFKAYQNEKFFGLGQHQHGRLNQKGCTIEFHQRNTEISIPFMYSNRGYGFLWNLPSAGRVELSHNWTRWVSEATQQMDYWITVGNSPSEIMENYAKATGKTPKFPSWASGFWQCKLRYRNQEELLNVARDYKKKNIPLSVIVIDFYHWRLNGDWKFDPEFWPDPKAMVRELEEMGVKLMVSVWPYVHPWSDNYSALFDQGFLIRTERGNIATTNCEENRYPGIHLVANYDATNPDARKYMWSNAKEHYYKYGIKIFWLDMIEPTLKPGDLDNIRFHIGNGLEVSNIFPLHSAQAFYEGLKAEGEEEIATLCRSAWAGMQRYGAILWSGDIFSTFKSLKNQIPAGLNIAMSGISWWNTDIGGFIGADPSTPQFRELIIRWFQYGVFCPVTRLHGLRDPYTRDEMLGTGGPNEIWSFGDEVYEIIKKYLAIREKLRPYIHQQMEITHEKGIPIMRPLFFDFPNDSKCYDIADQYLFGHDLLVAPITEKGEIHRCVYLPQGATWTDVWNGNKYDGGQVISINAPLEIIPLFFRDDVRLPINE